jgi:transcriptional regulator NrdR family protein
LKRNAKENLSGIGEKINYSLGILQKLYIYCKIYIAMTNVIKRGGKEQKFSPSKIKRAINKAATEAKMPPAERKILVRVVGGAVIKACRKRKTVNSSVIRKLIVQKLKTKARPVALSWIKYEKRHKKRR